ncbi:MAG: hypothetical protein FJZ57_00540 [Chlamydiae bacterium]|nr:hypothetical protein [Chlamydiota bacterium]
MNDDFSFVIIIHIISGIVAAFIAFPIAIAARKGSLPHVIAGKTFLLSYLLICFTGYILDYQELKSIFFMSQKASFNFYSYDSVYNSGERTRLHVFFTAAINTFAAYLVISGWRIASQHYKGTKTALDKIFDISIALLLIFGCIVFFKTGVVSLSQNKNPSYVLLHKTQIICILAAISLGGFVEATLDILRATGCYVLKRWWLEHMRKMFLAEFGLIIAFIYRCYYWKYSKELLIFSIIFFSCLFVFMYLRMKKSNNKKLK